MLCVAWGQFRRVARECGDHCFKRIVSEARGRQPGLGSLFLQFANRTLGFHRGALIGCCSGDGTPVARPVEPFLMIAVEPIVFVE